MKWRIAAGWATGVLCSTGLAALVIYLMAKYGG